MSKTMHWVSVAVLLGAACQWRGDPIPVAGDVALLQGKWEGGYSSEETGRSGSIIFELTAGADSAYGEVFMFPKPTQDIRGHDDLAPSTVRPQMPPPLRIGFVRCDAGRLAGTMAVYQDPETGERRLTTFDGQLVGNEFKGTYLTRTETTGRLMSGDWSVRRSRP